MKMVLLTLIASAFLMNCSGDKPVKAEMKTELQLAQESLTVAAERECFKELNRLASSEFKSSFDFMDGTKPMFQYAKWGEDSRLSVQFHGDNGWLISRTPKMVTYECSLNRDRKSVSYVAITDDRGNTKFIDWEGRRIGA